MQLLQWLILILYLRKGEAVSTENKGPLMLKGTVGKSIILPLNIPSNKKVEKIFWMSGKVIATVEGQNNILSYSDPQYNGRLKSINYTLQINKLKMQDENIYKGQIILKNSDNLFQEYFLNIYEELRKPQIIKNVTSENGTCNISLLCFMEKEGKNVTYNWLSLKGGEEVILYEGPIFTISWKPGESELNYICRVTNPVSNHSTQATSLQELCPGESSSNNSHMVTGFLIVCILCIVILIIIMIICKKKSQDSFSFSTNHHEQQDAATESNTVYAQVNHPNRKKTESPDTPDKKDSITIYYSVQSPQKQNEATPPERSAYDRSI